MAWYCFYSYRTWIGLVSRSPHKADLCNSSNKRNRSTTNLLILVACHSFSPVALDHSMIKCLSCQQLQDMDTLSSTNCNVLHWTFFQLAHCRQFWIPSFLLHRLHNNHPVLSHNQQPRTKNTVNSNVLDMFFSLHNNATINRIL